jgi:hypothetical protein
MNKTTGPRQRSKRTKQLIIAGAMAAAVGGFGVAITLPANASSGSFCATKSCKGPTLPGGKGSAEMILPLTGEGFSRGEAISDLNDACAKVNGTVIKITKVYSESDDDGEIFYADGDCSVGGANRLR